MKTHHSKPIEHDHDKIAELALDARLSADEFPMLWSKFPQLMTILLENASQASLFTVGKFLVSDCFKNGANDVLDVYLDQICGTPNIEEFLDKINNATSKSVLFVARKPYFTILRQAAHLIDQGFSVFILYSKQVERNVEETFNTTFTYALQIPDYVPLFEKIIAKSKVDVLHIQAWMFDYAFAAWLVSLKSRPPIVVEFYDITSLYAPEEKLKENWNHNLVELDIEMEGVILRKSDGVITRFDEAAITHLKSFHGDVAPILKFWPFPSSKFAFSTNNFKTLDIENLSTVFAGGVFPINEAHPATLFPGRGFLSAAKKLLEQGISVDVLHDPNRPIKDEQDVLTTYIDLAMADPRFRFTDGHSPNKVAEELAKYDFGLILFDIPPEVLENQPLLMRWGVGTKLFTYLEAGIPVLVNSEYETMAAFVETHGIGLALNSHDISKLKQKLKETDISELRENVRLFVEEYNMSKSIHQLIEFYATVTSNYKNLR